VIKTFDSITLDVMEIGSPEAWHFRFVHDDDSNYRRSTDYFVDADFSINSNDFACHSTFRNTSRRFLHFRTASAFSVLQCQSKNRTSVTLWHKPHKS